MIITPAKESVLITPVKLTEISKGTIITPVVAKDQPELGRILEIGQEGKKGLPVPGLKKDDIIAYRRYGESKFFLEGREVLFVGFADILAIIKPEEK